MWIKSHPLHMDIYDCEQAISLNLTFNKGMKIRLEYNFFFFYLWYNVNSFYIFVSNLNTKFLFALIQYG